MTIKVKDLWSDGNSFAILGKCRRAMRENKWDDERTKKFITEATSGDYDHLLQTVISEFDQFDEDEDAVEA